MAIFNIEFLMFIVLFLKGTEMLKELNLLPRTIYMVALTTLFNLLTGFSSTSLLVGVGALIFFNSFLIEYYVLHFALKNVADTKVGRNKILFIWAIICLVIVVFAGNMMPNLKQLSAYENTQTFLIEISIWSTLFLAFGTALVAIACTRRSFERYGGL